MRARSQLVHLLLAGVLPWLPGDVRAACNVIPAAQGVFRGDAGSLDRPFARPGDVVEIAPDASCATRPRRLARRAKAHVVTIAWRAPDRPAEIVVLAPSCRVLASRLRRCRARANVGRVTCLKAHLGRGLRDLERHEGPDGAQRLRFRFPDTDALVGTAGDGLTLAGPAAIAVTRRGKALPCELASTPCESMQGVVACVDTLRARNGTCDRSMDATFPSFTALPPANDFAALCHDPTPPCRSTPGDARFTLDAAGNVLLPMSWRSVLVDSEAVPVPRLLRATIRLPAFPGGATPVRVPGASFLASFSPEGSRLPPIFDPQRNGEETNALTLFGSVDAPETVLRMARRAPAASDGTLVLRECHGGRDDGLPCAGADDCLDGVCDTARCTAGTRTGLACVADAECPDGACGRGLFDLRNLAVDGGGPHLAPAAALDVRALEAVPLDGLIRAERLYAFVVSEPLVGADVNGDGDRVDDVLTIRDRLSGDGRPVGRNGTAGRALVRVREPPFSFPAVDVAGDVVAFLESETTEGASDRTGDGDLLDGLLRVLRLDAGTVTDLVGDSPITGDTAPRVNGRSLVVSDGLVVFRSREQATTPLVVERVSVGSGGIEGTGTAEPGLDSVSADGRFVVFESAAPNLVPGDTNGVTDVFLRDRVTDTTTRVSVGPGDAEAHGVSSDAVVSDDGMRIAFRSAAANLVAGDTNQLEDVFLRDVVLGTTVRLNVTSGGGEVRGLTSKPGISGDGRVVAFASLASDLVPDDTNGVADLFVRDVASGVTERVSLASDGAEGNGESTVPPNTPPPVSRDGRFVLFASNATDLVPADTNGVIDTFLHDRLTGQTERVNVASDGGEANAESYGASVSDDGRFVVFDSFASNLVAGDTNGLRDTFVRDRRDRLTLRESIAVDGTQADGFSVGAALSRDARFLVFSSDARTLIPGDTAGLFSVLLRDRTTGLAARVSRRWDGQAAGGAIPSLALDAGQVLFEAGTPLTPEDTNGRLDAYLASADADDPRADLTGDGDSDDTVLQVLDGETGARTVLCPADEVAVDGDAVAFLRPESAGPAAGCPLGPGGDLDGDGDATDAVVHVWSRGGAVVNLGRAATAVALSGPWLAALLSERDDGATDRNGDGDLDDRVVGVHRLDAPPDTWTVIGHAADAVGISGDLIVFLMPEAHEAGQDLSGDGDADDHLLRVYDAARDTLLDVVAPASDFVAGAHLVAFRSPEAARPAATCDGNGDGDCADDVLEVFDGASARRVSSGQAATPCRLEACDPREPYRVDGDTVKFLTLEGEQGASDLDGDGDASDLVLQLFNVRLALLRQQGRAATGPEGLRTPRAADRVLAGVVSTVAAVSAGICTNSGTACGTTAACRGGTCFVPPGGCILDLGTPCNPLQAGACGAAHYCAPILGRPGEGTCHEVQGPCRYDDDCTAPARCNDVDQRRQRLAGPLARTPEPGTLFIGTGHCVERMPATCGTAADCPAGAFCDGEGVCGREHGSCRADGDCPRGTRCEADLVTTAAADSDGDELPDVLDNCPGSPNVDQADADADGVGDACDAAP